MACVRIRGENEVVQVALLRVRHKDLADGFLANRLPILGRTAMMVESLSRAGFLKLMITD
jgi:hypothetical protein